MADESYEGWTNRETWAVALWINNDQGWQEGVHEALRALVDDDPEPESREDMAYEAGQIVKDNVESLVTADGHREMFGEPRSEELERAAEDIGSLWRVNWTELGESFLSDLAER